MRGRVGTAVINACVVAVALAGAAHVYAKETRTYCDNMCGDTQYCQYICCHITTDRPPGVPFDMITNISCSSSICCAQPSGGSVPSSIKIPSQEVTGVSGPITWGLVTAGLDASAIAVESDATTMTVMLTGSVTSAAQRTLASSVARKYAKGYKVVNRLTIAP